MAIRIKNGKILIKNGKIAFGADGSPCGCCGGGACKFHETAPLLFWEIREDQPQGPAGSTIIGATARQKNWAAHGQMSPPASGALTFADLPVSCPQWYALFGSLPEPAKAVKRWVPAWSSRAYTLTGLSISGTSLTTDVDIDNWHTFNGLPFHKFSDAVLYDGASPAAATPWANFFSVTSSYPSGVSFGGAAYVDFDALATPADQLRKTDDTFLAGADAPLIDSAPNLSGQFGIPGGAGAVMVLRMRLGGTPSPVIELSSYSTITDGAGAPVVGGTLEGAFPVTLANSHANFDHSFSVVMTIKDSGGATVTTFTAEGYIHRSAWGATAMAPVVATSVHTISVPGGRYGTGGKARLENKDISPLPAYPWSSQYELTLYQEGEDRTVTTGPQVEHWWPVIGTHDIAFSALTAAAVDFPGMILSDAVSGAMDCPGSFSQALAQSHKPTYGELTIATVRQGTGFSAIPSGPGINLGTWETDVTITSDVDLTAKYPGYDSVILPAGTVMKGRLSGLVKAAWYGTSQVRVSTSSFPAYESVTLNTVVGGVPGTMTRSLLLFTPSSNAYQTLPLASPSFNWKAFSVGWASASSDFAGTVAALDVYTPANESAGMTLNVISGSYWINPSAVAVVTVSLTSPTIGGRSAYLSFSEVAEDRAITVLDYITPTADSVELLKGVVGPGANYVTEAGQAWLTTATVNLGVSFDVDLTKTYGSVRLENGCEVPAPLNGEGYSVTQPAPETDFIDRRLSGLDYRFYDNLSIFQLSGLVTETPPVDLQYPFSGVSRANALGDVALASSATVTISLTALPPP